MNIILQEWKSYRKQLCFWSIGLLSLLIISFYKVQGLSSTPGGLEEMMKSMPAPLQMFFGSISDAGGLLGAYRMIHLYLCIALAFHAVMLGAHIFAKEEQDKTFEFLYVKGVSRFHILMDKILAGTFLLLLLDVVCILGVGIASLIIGYEMVILDIFPYLAALFLLQLFFFSLALLISLIMPHNQKAGMVGCCIVFVMFLITMYVKMGGNLMFLDKLSMFHYVDVTYMQAHRLPILPTIVIICIACAGFVLSQVVHEHRDLL